MGNLTGKRAWVVGGGSGLGAGAARALARDGAEIVVSGRRQEALERTCRLIVDEGGTARAEPLDVARPETIPPLIETLGPIDILVYSSGTNVPRRALGDIALADWTTIVDVNLSGAFHAVRAVLPGMRERGAGLIVVVSSWVGWRLEPVAGGAYTATKQALLALTETINVEEGRHGIRATCLCPAEVDTDVLDKRPMPPSQAERARMLKAEDIGSVVSFLAQTPRHMCVNQIVLSPTINRFYDPGL